MVDEVSNSFATNTLNEIKEFADKRKAKLREKDEKLKNAKIQYYLAVAFKSKNESVYKALLEESRDNPNNPSLSYQANKAKSIFDTASKACFSADTNFDIAISSVMQGVFECQSANNILGIANAQLGKYKTC